MSGDRYGISSCFVVSLYPHCHLLGSSSLFVRLLFSLFRTSVGLLVEPWTSPEGLLNEPVPPIYALLSVLSPFYIHTMFILRLAPCFLLPALRIPFLLRLSSFLPRFFAFCILLAVSVLPVL